MSVTSRTATCPTCKVRGEWRASAKGYQYMVTITRNGRFANRVVHMHDGKRVWRPWGEYRTGSPTGRTPGEPGIQSTHRLWSDVKLEALAMRVHAGTFIGPMMRLEDCIHNVTVHGGSIRTCIRCGHSLVN